METQCRYQKLPWRKEERFLSLESRTPLLSFAEAVLGEEVNEQRSQAVRCSSDEGFCR